MLSTEPLTPVVSPVVLRSCADHTDTCWTRAVPSTPTVSPAGGGINPGSADTSRAGGGSFNAKSCASGGVCLAENA